MRKEQCNYGWDWGPCLLTCGIRRPIKLVAYDTARLGEVSFRQKHRKSGEVLLDINADLTDAGTGKSLSAEVSVSMKDEKIASGNARFRNGAVRVRLVIDRLSPQVESPSLHGETILLSPAGIRRGRY